jgi:hypothetical protein
MYFNLLQDQNLFNTLCKIDKDYAQEQRCKPCKYCGATVHYSNYYRKLRGGVDALLVRKFSLCCSVCRKRIYIPSTLFAGNFVYCSVFFIIISCFLSRHGYRVNRLASLFKVSIRTIKRWQKWWNDSFRVSKFWKEKRGHFPLELKNLPLDIVEQFETPEAIFIFFMRIKEPAI